MTNRGQQALLKLKWMLALSFVPTLVYLVVAGGLYAATEYLAPVHRWQEQLLCEPDEKLVGYKIVYEGGNRTGVHHYQCCQKRRKPGECASWDSQTQFHPGILVLFAIPAGVAGITFLILFVRYRRATRGHGPRA